MRGGKSRRCGVADNQVATGFLRMAPDGTWAKITGFVPDRLDVIADEIDVFGSTVMSLTMKCARCHSHIFDPIPHRDYYRLLDAIYNIQTGKMGPGRPSLGSWVVYGLGSENQNLPAYVVLDDPLGLPVNGVENWHSGFLPPRFQEPGSGQPAHPSST